MCGIAGYIDIKNNPISRDLLEDMVNTLYHRGPDEIGLGMHDNVSMGMRRLSIIDLSGGSQPIYNEDKSIWTVFNGEIYNFKELRQKLIQAGHTFSTNVDTEVIVHAYEEYGVDFPKHLNGMFAIALHDRKKHKIILSRDHLGIKPLFYSFNSSSLIFGSEIKAILKSNRMDTSLDYNSLNEFLTWEYVPGENTLFNEIKKLNPGYSLVLDLNTKVLSKNKYWDLSNIAVDNSLTENDWINLVDKNIHEAVNRQMVSDVPLGAFLSGGVDSSLIVASMGNAKTFSIGFDDPSYNELTWARKVADHLGVNHNDEIISPNILEMFESLMNYMDDPIGDFSIFPTYLVSKLAREHVTVALSGDGGDELFGGYETYLANDKFKFLEAVPEPIRKNIIIPLISRIKPTGQKKGFINKLKRFIEGGDFPKDLSHTRWRVFLNDLNRSSLYTEDASKKFSRNSFSHILNLFNEAESMSTLNKSLYVDVKSYLCDNILTKVDRMSMSVSLESRVPFLEPGIAELAFSMPDKFKVSNGITKKVLKQVTSKYVPKECVYRPKEGFSIPIKNWLKDEFKPLMNNLLSPERINSDGIFNSKFIEQLKTEHINNVANHSHILWSLIIFHDWKNRWL